MAQPLPPRITLAEYLAIDRESEVKHEFVDGYMIPVHGDPATGMAGAAPEHNSIVGNVVTALNNALRNNPCRVFPSDLKVKAIRAPYYYPDATVACSPIYDEDEVLQNPSVVVEVLADSTERRDRGEKAHSYRALPSCTDYLLCSSTEVLIEHQFRSDTGRWELREYGAGEHIELRGLGITVSVDAIYLKVFR